MFHKDTFRLIRKTRKRFVTIVLIVLIGVAFMVGLMCSAPTMKTSVDAYFDQTNFMDVQLFSSYGFDDRDVKALKAAEQVKDVYATRFADVYAKVGDSTIVTRVQETDSNVNQIVLVDGRMPSAANEALALGSSSFASVFSIGDTVQLYLNDEDLSEKLANTEYKIVGIAKTPQYMASSRETSTLDNLNLDTVIFVDDSQFLADYFTSIYITLKDARPLEAFTTEYRDFVENSLDDLDSVIRKQQTVRRDETIEEVIQEIEDGEKEMEEEVSKAQKEIDDGRQKLEDAYIQILVGEAQIENSEKQIEEGEKQLADGERQLADGEKQLNDAKKKIEDETGMSYSEASTTIQTAYGVYLLTEKVTSDDSKATVQEELDAKKAQRTQLQEDNAVLTAENVSLTMESNQLTDENNTLDAENKTLSETNKQLEEENASLDAEADAEKIAENNKTIAENKAAIDVNNIKIAANTVKVAANNSTKEKNNKIIEENNAEIDRLDEEIQSLQTISSFMGNEVLSEIQAESMKCSMVTLKEHTMVFYSWKMPKLK